MTTPPAVSPAGEPGSIYTDSMSSGDAPVIDAAVLLEALGDLGYQQIACELTATRRLSADAKGLHLETPFGGRLHDMGNRIVVEAAEADMPRMIPIMLRLGYLKGWRNMALGKPGQWADLLRATERELQTDEVFNVYARQFVTNRPYWRLKDVAANTDITIDQATRLLTSITAFLPDPLSPGDAVFRNVLFGKGLKREVTLTPSELLLRRSVAAGKADMTAPGDGAPTP